MEETKRKRRWFRFSLRTLFVLVTLTGVWLGFEVSAARRQREAVAVIQKGHAYVCFDYEMVANPSDPDHLVPASMVPAVSKITGTRFPPTNPNPSPSGPAWLRKLVGDEYFREVYQVSMGGPQYEYVKESEFAQLASLSELRNLYLADVKIATGPHMERRLVDSDLFVLAHMLQLRQLIIEDADISDAGLEHLKRLKKLTTLILERTKGTPVGIRGFQKALPNARITGP